MFFDHPVPRLVSTVRLEHRHQRHPGHADEHLPLWSACGYLTRNAAPILVVGGRRTGTLLALLVRGRAADVNAVENLKEWVDTLGPAQVAIRC